MGRQIRFFLCPMMRSAIETEAHRIGATLVSNSAWGTQAIEFSTSAGEDHQQGRLWTEAADPGDYKALCRAVKKDSTYDRDSGLWVKKKSQPSFESYRAATEKALAELVEKNKKYAVEVLGARIVTKKT